jgi:LysR family transcriptional regulator, regulator for bpeEF and oprC
MNLVFTIDQDRTMENRAHERLTLRMGGIEEFVRVAELKSFVRAAESMGLSTSGVARSVRILEKRVGVRLLNRTTRRVSLTDEGAGFYLRCKRLLMDFEEAESELSSAQTQPQGVLRVDLPVAYGRLVILPYLGEFLRAYPAVQVDFRLNDRYVDIVDEGIDVAVRAGHLPDSGLIARRIGRMDMATFASPTYLERHGIPSHPNDLAQHHVLRFVFPNGQLQKLKFGRDDVLVELEPSSSVIFNHSEALTDAAIQGIGIVQVPKFHATAALHNHQLVPILSDWEVEGNPIQIVYPQNRHLSSKIRVFVEFFQKVLQKQ